MTGAFDATVAWRSVRKRPLVLKGESFSGSWGRGLSDIPFEKAVELAKEK
jgi:hypothetical protein